MILNLYVHLCCVFDMLTDNSRIKSRNTMAFVISGIFVMIIIFFCCYLENSGYKTKADMENELNNINMTNQLKINEILKTNSYKNTDPSNIKVIHLSKTDSDSNIIIINENKPKKCTRNSFNIGLTHKSNTNILRNNDSYTNNDSINCDNNSDIDISHDLLNPPKLFNKLNSYSSKVNDDGISSIIMESYTDTNNNNNTSNKHVIGMEGILSKIDEDK